MFGDKNQTEKSHPFIPYEIVDGIMLLLWCVLEALTCIVYPQVDVLIESPCWEMARPSLGWEMCYLLPICEYASLCYTLASGRRG